ncbi:MAG TPA: DUF3108 domain-containing protein [Gammaproteobacteria bacterium]|nr:DUF3108 domain-containing protein [Gammaproteobacteria bacterium]
MKIFSIVTSLMILGIASSAQAAMPAAAPFQFKNYAAHYTLRYDGIPFGKSTTTLLVNNPPSHYDLCIDNRTTLPFLHGNVEECSDGTLTPTRVKPNRYDYFYHRGDTHEHIRIEFNWKKHIATITTMEPSKSSQWHIAIPENTQDKVSYQLLLRRGLAQGKTAFSFPIADGGKLKTYAFHVDTAENQKNTVKIIRDPMPSKEKLTIWFRSDIDYIVSKVKQHKNIADIGTASLDSFSWEKHV